MRICSQGRGTCRSERIDHRFLVPSLQHCQASEVKREVGRGESQNREVPEEIAARVAESRARTRRRMASQGAQGPEETLLQVWFMWFLPKWIVQIQAWSSGEPWS